MDCNATTSGWRHSRGADPKLQTAKIWVFGNHKRSSWILMWKTTPAPRIERRSRSNNPRAAYRVVDYRRDACTRAGAATRGAGSTRTDESW